MRPIGWSNPPTFRARLMAWTALLSIGVLTAAGVAVYLGASRALRANLDDALLSIARTQITSALHGPDGDIHLPRGLPAQLALPAGSGYEEFVQIEDAAGHVVARTPNLDQGPPLRPDAARASAALSGRVSFGDTRLGRAPYRAIYYPLRDRQGRRLAAVIAVAQEPVRRSLRSLLGVILAALVFAGVAAAWASGRLAERLTRPLSRIAAASRSVGEENLAVRIPVVSPDEELRHVTDVLNDMLARLEAAFLNQRRFVADASHELRSPLSNLRGTVEVALRRERSAEEYRETLAVSLAEVERLSRLVADLLILSRADSGELVRSTVPMDLAAIVRESVASHRPRAETASVEMRVRAEQPMEVVGSADRLRQVVDNLLDNALRYAPAGTPIEVCVFREEGRAVLTVRDHGPGIAPEMLPHVFDRFFRADPARARRSGGAGLGLAIARAIVQAHRGEIDVLSRPGAGAEFTVRLPMAPE